MIVSNTYYTPQHSYDLLKSKFERPDYPASCEITARLLDRAVIYSRDPKEWFRRSSVLDQLAAQWIEHMVRVANPDKDIEPWCKLRDSYRKYLYDPNGEWIGTREAIVNPGWNSEA